ncbi:MAG: hypothetical protein LBM99_06495 [Bacillales bacterium]|jgi:hypothetical protein|nr:hypothetical protein [Bacillales bacterium]
MKMFNKLKIFQIILWVVIFLCVLGFIFLPEVLGRHLFLIILFEVLFTLIYIASLTLYFFIKSLLKVLEFHYERYSKMEAVDFIKVLYQAYMGPGHLINEVDTLLFLKDELFEVVVETEYFEYVGNSMYRVYLYKGIDIELLNKAFVNSSKRREQLFLLKLAVFLLPKELKLLNYDYKSVSHSSIYRETYKPHYRVVNSKELQEYLNYGKEKV